jgi:hypothetical protein
LWSSLGLVVAFVTAMASLTSFAPKKVEAASTADVVDVYGDSLMSQMQGPLQFQLALDGIKSSVQDFGGTALCDWFPKIESQVMSAKPITVVIEFSGNALTPCMAGANSEAAIVAKYRSDLTYIATWLHAKGVALMVVGGPPGIEWTGQTIVIPTTWSVGQIPEGYAPRDTALNDMYQAVVRGYQDRGWDINYIPAGQAVGAPDGMWTYVLPCLSFETAAMGCNPQGLIIVRAPDFGHLCHVPVTTPSGPGCAVWDAGGWRYAAAISAYVNTVFSARHSYWLTEANGQVYNFRAGLHSYISTAEAHPNNETVVGIAADPVTGGYWLATSDGHVIAVRAPFYGSAAGLALDQPIVGIAAAPNGDGYWLVARDGGVFAFGPSAHFYGSTGGIALHKPIVGITASPEGNGYWLVASDGGVFAFGTRFYGSTGGITLDKPIVGIAAAPDGTGYWLAASDGGVFAFGPRFYGSTGGITLDKPIVGIAAAPDGTGYWLAASDGGVFAFGPSARFYGSAGGMTLARPIVSMASA